MMDRPVSDSLKDLLGRQGMRSEVAGTTKPRSVEKAGGCITARPQVSPDNVIGGDWMGWANDLIDNGHDIEDHSPAGGEERPVRKPKVRIVRAMPFLAVIEGGLS